MTTIDLTKDNFEQVVMTNSLVFIDFWAPWCAPCRTFAPVMEEAADRHPEVVFCRVNTDEQVELAALFEIRSIPTLVIFRDQIGIFAQAGVLPGEALESIIEQAQALDMDQVRRRMAEGEAGEEDRLA